MFESSLDVIFLNSYTKVKKKNCPLANAQGFTVKYSEKFRFQEFCK